MGIKELYLENFKGFEKYRIKFKKETVMVGKNNAGKSSIIEALRLVALVTKRFKTNAYVTTPGWLKEIYKISLGAKVKGIEPNIKGLIKNYETIFFYYQDEKQPAYIKARLDDNFTVEIYIGKDEKIYAIIHDKKGNNINNKSMAINLPIDNINILPQIGQLASTEFILNEEYVKRVEMLPVTSLHFRNQLRNNIEMFPQFKKYMEEYLEDFEIDELIGHKGIPDLDKLGLIVKCEKFPAEIGIMGHGFQMWAQIIWFLVKSQNSDTIILDEPDVYLHADLQRKLYKLISNLGKQLIITTHSAEIISAVKSTNILIVNKKLNSSEFISDISEIKHILISLGSTHNMEITKLASSNKCLFIEGNDNEILNLFYKKLFPTDLYDLRDIPQMPTGGWGGWQRVVGVAQFLKEHYTNCITSYCLFDSDFHQDAEISKRLDSAREEKVQLYIWNQKEIENYLIVPNVFYKLCIKKNIQITKEQVEKKIEAIIDKSKDTLEIKYTQSICEATTGVKDIGKAMEKAKEYVNKHWNSLENKIALSSGKKILSEIKNWLQKDYKICMQNQELFDYIEIEDIDKEIMTVLTCIKENQPFPSFVDVFTL